MSNSYSIHSSHLSEGSTYGENLRRAFQDFVIALCDVKPSEKSLHKTLEHDRIKAMDEIYSLAKKFDATMPNQAAELRDLATRDCTAQ